MSDSKFKSKFGNFADDYSEENERLAESGFLGMCSKTGELFNIGKVEVIGRYSDCSLFKCPSCRKQHDDRVAWNQGNRTIDKNVRNGYIEIRSIEELNEYRYWFSSGIVGRR